MPRKPRHPCSYPGCPELVESGERFCRKHQQMENRRYERYDRDPSSKMRYGAEWRKIRKRYVALHPLCEECLKEGRYTPAEHVHHIVPLAEGGTNDEENLMSVCKSCHSRIHAKRGDRWHDRSPQGRSKS